MKTINGLAAAAAAVVALVSPSAFADSAAFRYGTGNVSVGVNIGSPPRAVQYIPVVVPEQVWVPGYWTWNGYGYVWNGGGWTTARPGYRQVVDHRHQWHEHWRGESSHWEGHRGKGRGHEDRQPRSR